MSDFIIRSIIIGGAATALLDLWALLLKAVFGFPTPNWAMGGRWFGHVFGGHFKHEDITKAPALPNELAIGWIGHYVVGIVFAGATLLIGGTAWIKAPTWPLPVFVGLVTVGCGWFIMQPGMGMGVAASKRPEANRIRTLNILGHIVFGIGLFGAALLLRGL
jgi:Protein of unknown function (DUF2938)